MFKLLYITTNLQGTGGVSRVLSIKLNYLIKEYGYKIHVITTNNKSDTFFYEFNSNIVFHKIDLQNFGFWHLLKYKRILQGLVNEVNPDIIINCDNGFKGALLPYIINTKAPLIYEKHGSKKISTATIKENIKNKVADFIVDRSMLKYQVFIVLSEEDKKDFKTTNVRFIPNPLWLKPLPEQSTLQYKVALAIGRQSIEKQFDKLLEIWKLVVQDYPDWTLKIYGESANGNTLKILADELKISTQVELYPPTKNVADVYSKASMLLNTSSSEAFGLTILEAMSCGLPVIAFDSASGPKMLIDSGNNGFLVKSFDIDAYANKIKLLINNEALKSTLGKNAKKSVSKYNIDGIMKQWHELLQSSNQEVFKSK